MTLFSELLKFLMITGNNQMPYIISKANQCDKMVSTFGFVAVSLVTVVLIQLLSNFIGFAI